MTKDHSPDAVVDRCAKARSIAGKHQVEDVLNALKPRDQLPSGLRVVREEPTDAMLLAFAKPPSVEGRITTHLSGESVIERWRAMLEASGED